MRITRLLAIAFLTLTAVAPAPALAEEITFKCYFDWVCDPNRKCQDAGEDIRFKVDVENNAVTRLGGNEMSQFSLILGDRALTILEITISGGTTTTTIKVSNGEAVHSVNGIEGNTLTPFQYLGECVNL
jgi:hypothetical protein